MSLRGKQKRKKTKTHRNTKCLPFSLVGTKGVQLLNETEKIIKCYDFFKLLTIDELKVKRYLQ